MTLRGTTSVELLVVLILVAIVTALCVPSLRYAADRLAVGNAAQELVRAHEEARSLAATTQRTALLTIAADSIVLRTTRDGDTVLVWHHPGPEASGITLGGAAHLFRFIPYGYSVGTSNATYILTRGSARRQVIIARYGRVRIQ
jgi:Tfp pilus assembly protein FimT